MLPRYLQRVFCSTAESHALLFLFIAFGLDKDREQHDKGISDGVSTQIWGRVLCHKVSIVLQKIEFETNVPLLHAGRETTSSVRGADGESP